MSKGYGFFDHDPDSLRQWCVDHGLPGHTANQLMDWVYRKRVVDPQQMTNLSRDHRALIEATLPIDEGRTIREQTGSDGTQKLLIEWPTKSTTLPIAGAAPATETVMIPAGERRTACISSQIGCPVGCRFCASGIGGLEGNLSAGRIVEQAHRLDAEGGEGREAAEEAGGQRRPPGRRHPVAGQGEAAQTWVSNQAWLRAA